MGLAAELLSIICCPQCEGDLRYAAKDQALVCPRCLLCFKIHAGRIDLRTSEASILSKKGELIPISKSHISLKPLQGPIAQAQTDSHPSLSLPKSSCVVIGRATETLDRSAGKDDDIRREYIPLDSQLNEHAKKMLSNFMAGRGRPHTQSLRDDPVLFGFKRLADIVVPDASISKAHCLLFYDDAGFGLFDLFSLNGTYVNGKEVESCALAQGDIVQFGQSALKIIIPE